MAHFLPVAEWALRDGSVGIDQDGVPRGLDDAVLEVDAADRARLELRGIGGIHGIGPFALSSFPKVVSGDSVQVNTYSHILTLRGPEALPFHGH